MAQPGSHLLGELVVRATENTQISLAPWCTFSRDDERSSDNQIHPGNEHLQPKVMVGCFLLCECSLAPYDQYTRKLYIFQQRVVLFEQAVFEGGIRDPLRFARSNFLRSKKNKKSTKIRAKNRVRNVTRSFHFRETHPHNLK